MILIGQDTFAAMLRADCVRVELVSFVQFDLHTEQIISALSSSPLSEISLGLRIEDLL
jgi:hypothetical protein